MISLSLYATKHGKSRSAAMKYFRQGRIKGARMVETLVGSVIMIPDNSPWPKPAKPGSLTQEQRASWPKA
jgi:hypothetical protein